MSGVEDSDLGWNRIVKNLQRLDGTEISAGILQSAGSYSKGQSLVDVAIWNEYGTQKIPSRPFIRIASDQNRRKWERLSADCINEILDGSRTRPGYIGKRIGKAMKADIQAVMGDKSKLAPNAPSTIKKKGHDKPLIDTGKLQSSVDYRVEGKE